MFEHHHEKLLPRRELIRCLLKHAAVSLALILVSLIIGKVGYRLSEDMSWIDAFLNAEMLMGGMGPVNVLHSDGAKMFAGIYALHRGLVELIAIGIFAAQSFIDSSITSISKPRNPLRQSDSQRLKHSGPKRIL